MNTMIQEDKETMGKAQKVMLLFAMGSIVMLFAGLTSAYVVSKSRPDWLIDFNLPTSFMYSTLVLIISSVTFVIARKSIKRDERSKTTIYLISTLLLGILFIYFQFRGFGQIVETGYFLTGSESNITTSFLYVIVVAHIAHIIAAIVSLLFVIYNHLNHKYNSRNLLGIELSEMFWHFLDLVWIYLFLFFTFFN